MGGSVDDCVVIWVKWGGCGFYVGFGVGFG